MYTHTHTHAHTHTHVRECTHTHRRVLACTYTCTYTCTHTHTIIMLRTKARRARSPSHFSSLRSTDLLTWPDFCNNQKKKHLFLNQGNNAQEMPEFSTLTPVQHLSDARSVNLPFCQGKNRHVQGERRNIETKLSHKWPGPPETGTMCLHPWPGPNLTPDSSTLALWVRLFHCTGVCLWQTDQQFSVSLFLQSCPVTLYSIQNYFIISVIR